jgi:hypothetical protein
MIDRHRNLRLSAFWRAVGHRQSFNRVTNISREFIFLPDSAQRTPTVDAIGMQLL